ncbi:membrane frizzled-related protein isoform 2-T2 [Rhinophrynus dorsalis]
MAITRHIQGWESLHSTNMEMDGAGDSSIMMQEPVNENSRASLCTVSEEEVKFCNPAFDPMSELIFSGTPKDNDLSLQSNLQSYTESSVSLQKRSCCLQRPRLSIVSIIIITSLLLLLVLVFSIALGILISKRKPDDQGNTAPASGNYSTLSSQGDIQDIMGSTESPPPGCGGTLSDGKGSFSSPNYPYLYPPNSNCSWFLEAGEGRLVQLKIVVLDVEGYGSCLIDWLELSDGNTTSRFCGSVAPTTFISSSHWLKVVFVSDGSIEATGFMATYRMIEPSQGSCSWDEFLCDGRRCLVLPSLCDGIVDCEDQRDEKNCSQRHWDCGRSLTNIQGSLSSPNHPGLYPGKMVCRWIITVPDGLIIQLHFHNFSLESDQGCKFDYVEIHDSAGLGASSLMGRFCGSKLPPPISSSGAQMYILFVSDEEESDSGFYATYQALNATEITPCQPLQVPMCQGLSYSLTVFPNLWASLLEQPDANKLLTGNKILQELQCFPALRPFLCALLVPSCSEEGGALQPCRSVCQNAEQLCLSQLHQMGLSWPFNCDILPARSQHADCVIP